MLILWAVLRYRRKSDAIPRQSQYHTLFEIFYTVVPIIIVLVLFVFTFVTENEVDAIPPAPRHGERHRLPVGLAVPVPQYPA